jgi:release factor glutamine methyltransferase
VALYEPRTALDGGVDGLSAYRAIIPELPRLLAAEGAAVLEVGDDQAAAVGLLGQQAGLDAVAVHADLSGAARALVLRTAS